MGVHFLASLVLLVLAFSLNLPPLTCAEDGLYSASLFVGVGSIGSTVTWNIGHKEFNMEGDGSSSNPMGLENLCGKCDNLVSIGKASVAFTVIAEILTFAAVLAMIATLMGCIDLESWGNLVLGVVNSAALCSLLGALIMVCGIAVVVEGDGDGYRFFPGLTDPDSFKADFGGICAWVALAVYVVAAVLLRVATLPSVRAGGKGGGKGFSPSFAFGGSAMRPKAKPGKVHGKRPSGVGGKKGGYV